jgi:hypothetical protein
LPILGNRTDYLRDSPAGHAFYETVKRYFDDVYGPVRSEHDSRARKRGKASGQGPPPPASPDNDGSSEHDTEGGSETGDTNDVKREALAARFGEALNRLLDDRPELTPVLSSRAPSSRGRPRKDRVYPVRPDPSGKTVPFEEEEFGESLAVREDSGTGKILRASAGSVLRRASGEATPSTLGEIVQNPAAGIRVDFASLGRLEAPYRWDLDQEPPTLALNVDHKLFRALGDPTADPGRLHAAWLIALAFAELANPSRGQLLSDYLETVSYEIFCRMGTSSD